ncbi:response regulator [soil metagenome]
MPAQRASDSKLILLIEDNADDERLTRRAMRRNNVDNEIVVAVDGQEAVDWLFGSGPYADRDMTEMPAVVVLDLKLPRLSGLEVLQRIRGDARTKRVPVVVLTSSEDEEQMRAAYTNGANSFVRKPTDPSDFGDMILNLSMYWLLVNRPSPRA